MDKFNFTTIGTSWITESFITAARLCKDFELYSVYSRDADKANAFAEKNKAKKAFSSLDEVLSDKVIDAVYIASPNSFHAPQAIECMRHGKHVLCEKPIASNAAEFRKMSAAAKENGVLLMEAFKSCLLPGFYAYRDQLPKIGAVRSVFTNFSKYSTRYDAHKRGENVNTFKAEFSNGALMDLGVYCLYPVVKLFGRPKSVKTFSTIIPGGVDGAGVTILDYGTFTATLFYSKVGNSFLPCEIQGEDATICVDKFNIPEKVEVVYRDGRRENIPFAAAENDMYYEVREFLDCLREGKKESDKNTHELSLSVMEIMDEARKQSGIIYPADGKLL